MRSGVLLYSTMWIDSEALGILTGLVATENTSHCLFPKYQCGCISIITSKPRFVLLHSGRQFGGDRSHDPTRYNSPVTTSISYSPKPLTHTMDTAVDFAPLRNLSVVNHIDIAIAAINLFEYVITFELERRRIWARKRTAVTWIFLVNRYLAVAYGISMLLSLGIATEASCRALLLIPCVIFLGLGLVQAVFSSLRIRALWPHSSIQWPIIVFSLYLVPFATDIWDYSSLKPLKPQWFYQCAPQAGSTTNSEGSIIAVVVVNRLCVIAADVIVLLSTWIKTFRHRREMARSGFSTSIIHLLLRDGTVSFVVLLSLNIIQILMAAAPPWTSFSAVNEFVHWPALYPVVISRFLLDLRQINDPIDPDDENPVVPTSRILTKNSHINITDSTLGNLGEALHGPFDSFDKEERQTHGSTLEKDLEKAVVVSELAVSPYSN
ncbi:hypothetical protein BDY19DRAFT_952927, partial [Irpex rosettiformis]